MVNMDKLKKATVAVFAAAISAASAQSLELSNIDNMVFGEPTAAYLQGVATVTNNSSNAIDVLVSFEELTPGPVGSGHYFCWTVCYNEGGITDGFVTPPNHALTLDAGASTNNFYADYVPHGTVGIAEYRYTFYDRNNPSDAVSVDITFDTQNVGVEELEAGSNAISESYPNPAHRFVKMNYSVAQSAKTAEVVVYSMLGAKVKRVGLEEKQGTLRIDVSSLPSGMYFYSLLVDDKAISTKKMLVTSR